VIDWHAWQKEQDARYLVIHNSVETRIKTVREAILHGYNWKSIETIEGHRWELEKAPIRAVIEISHGEIHPYKLVYSKNHPEYQYRAYGNPEPLQDIICPCGKLTGISGYSGEREVLSMRNVMDIMTAMDR
jgi:hypothetical protein